MVSVISDQLLVSSEQQVISFLFMKPTGTAVGWASTGSGQALSYNLTF
jgi:hypothetical protein